MPRPLRIDYDGALHHIIVKGNGGIDIFTDNSDRERLLNSLSSLVKRYNFKVYAYCLMRNHIHLLVETAETPLSRLMREFLTGYVQYFNKRWNRKGHLLGDRYKSILVDKDAYLLTLQRYIHLNPVKAGIVEHPADYMWSSYKEYMGLKDTFIDVSVVLAYFNNDLKKFEAFTLEGIKMKKALKPKRVQNYTVYGDEDFVNRILIKVDKERRRKRPEQIKIEDIYKFLSEKYKFEIEEFNKWNRDIRNSMLIVLLRERAHLKYKKISEILNVSNALIIKHLKKFEDKKSLLDKFDKWILENTSKENLKNQKVKSE